MFFKRVGWGGGGCHAHFDAARISIFSPVFIDKENYNNNNNNNIKRFFYFKSTKIIGARGEMGFLLVYFHSFS
jgi:hypothetical protein